MGHFAEKNMKQNEQKTERTAEMKHMCIQSVLPVRPVQNKAGKKHFQ